MNLEERYKIDFGKNIDSFGYQIQLKNSGWLQGYSFHCVFNLKDYFQFSVVVCDKLDENYKKIPEALLAFKISENDNQYTVYQLKKENPPFISIPHNRNLYIYCEQNQIATQELINFFLNFNLRVIIRDKKYFDMQKADFFISHDSRDKKDVAKPLYDELTKKGFKVWYDEYSLNIGDSLTESIEKGITESKHGILILSKNFLSNEKWAKNELQSLKTKQIVLNQKVILPVWHQISEEDLKDNYWLLDKVGGNTKDGIENLAERLKETYNNA